MTTAEIAALEPTLTVGMVRRWARDVGIKFSSSSIARKQAHSSSRRPADYTMDEAQEILAWGLGTGPARLILGLPVRAQKPALDPAPAPRSGSIEPAPDTYMKDHTDVHPVHEPDPSLRTAVSRIVVAYGLPRGDIPGAWRKHYRVYEQVYWPVQEPAKIAGRSVLDQIEAQGGMLNLLLLASGLFGGHIKAA